jgi:hypothetical protein
VPTYRPLVAGFHAVGNRRAGQLTVRLALTSVGEPPSIAGWNSPETPGRLIGFIVDARGRHYDDHALSW